MEYLILVVFFSVALYKFVHEHNALPIHDKNDSTTLDKTAFFPCSKF